MEKNFKNGKTEGIAKHYYGTGQLGGESNFKNGKLEGITRRYYKNGEYQYIDTYKDGKKINRKAYAARGKLTFDQDYPE
jgi:antitoxin component YwqK of YwqJK toxin-antitoxin module